MGIGGCLGPELSLLTNDIKEKKTEVKEKDAHSKKVDADRKSAKKKCDFRIKKSKTGKGYWRGKTRKTIVAKPTDISVDDENFKQLDNDVLKAVLTKRREVERLTV